MNSKDLSFPVIGAGAVGGITAALMKRAGYKVELVVRNRDYASPIEEAGIETDGMCGKHTVKMPVFPAVSDVKQKKDIHLMIRNTDFMNILLNMGTAF
jgi:2-dehydropantoate 2-reductase